MGRKPLREQRPLCLQSRNNSRQERMLKQIMKKMLSTICFCFCLTTICRADWIHTEDIDEMTDERKILICTDACGGTYYSSRLIVRITVPKLKSRTMPVEIFIVPKAGRYEKDIFFLNPNNGMVRFDADEPIEVSFSKSTSGEAIFFSDPHKILDLMKTHNRLVVRYDNVGLKTIKFKLTGINEALERANRSRTVVKPTIHFFKCKTCDNTGTITSNVNCPKCHGSGIFRLKHKNGKTSYSVEMPCPKCNNGILVKKIPCPDCHN